MGALNEAAALCAASSVRVEALKARLRGHGSALVAFSGGVDSALVLKLALDVLGERAVALTAISASVAPEEAEGARALARQLGAQHVEVHSRELHDERYAANPVNRCYFCKSELYALAEAERSRLDLAVVLDGFNADDRLDHRPGHQAAREHAVYSPLAEASLTKNEVRAWSYTLGLPTWNKPQQPCLASRLPYGTKVTVERLRQVGAAERAVRSLGFFNFRVRYLGDTARLETALEEQPRLNDAALRGRVRDAILAAGFDDVLFDERPFRSGRLNDALRSVTQ